MSKPLGGLSAQQFLSEYWQKRPCLVRQAFPGFTPAFDGDDLAGLACEDTAEARIVSGTFEAADWRVAYGPFDEEIFASLPGNDWTLLVQDVEKHYPPLQELLQQFSFIPGWRLDDLMISYAAKGGSVGPHADQYDVFLLQASGTRRWRIAVDYDPEPLHGCALNVLRSFTAEQEWVLEAGDMLYLPPGVAHHGIALEPGMTWSIGARAPSAADLLQGFGEWLAFSGSGDCRYSDPGLAPATRAGEMDTEALTQLRRLLLDQLGREDLDRFLAGYMSLYRLAQTPSPLEAALEPETVLQALSRGATLQRDPWTRLVWLEHGGRAQLFAAGQSFSCSTQLAETLCGHMPIRLGDGLPAGPDLETLTALINQGHVALAD